MPFKGKSLISDLVLLGLVGQLLENCRDDLQLAAIVGEGLFLPFMKADLFTSFRNGSKSAMHSV